MPTGYYDTHAFNASLAIYSPVTLSNEWPQLERLLFMIICAGTSSTANGFFVAAFCVEHTLRRIGNVFLACVGIADLLITSIVMPLSAVVLLSGEWDVLPVCKVLQFLTEASTYSYSIFFALVAGECQYRISHTAAEYDVILSMRIGCVSLILFCLSIVMAGLGVYMGLDYDYCERKHSGNFHFRLITLVMCYVIPGILTISALVSAMFHNRKKIREQPLYKRSSVYDRDCSTISLNLTAFLLYVAAWVPYLIIVHQYPSASDKKFYYYAWIGIARSAFTSFLYSMANRNFRRAFAQLFNYCCCKSSMSSSFANRYRRDCYRPSSDVRVHIMHKAVTSNSPQRQRPGCSTRETQDL